MGTHVAVIASIARLRASAVGSAGPISDSIPYELENSGEQSVLRDEHMDQLRRSGIVYANHLGVESDEKGLVFRYWDPEAKKFSEFYRRRMDDGRPKYLQPKGSGVKLYFPPTFLASRDDEARKWAEEALFGGRKPRSVVIVEGEKKALALQQAVGPRVVVIGLGGVQNFNAKERDGDRTLVKDFDVVKDWQRRKVFICFDSDVQTNPQVEKAEWRLQRALREQLRCNARLITIDQIDDQKTGVDDLVALHGDNFLAEWIYLTKQASANYRYRVPRPITGQEMVDTEWDHSEVILGDENASNILTEGGVAFVHAGSGVGKTYFMMQLAAAFSSGSDFIGFHTKKLKVLFMQQELSNGWFSRRVDKLLQHAEGAADIEFISGDLELASMDKYKTAALHMDRLTRVILRSDADVVFLDPIQGYYNLSESSVDHSREFMKGIVRVAHYTGAAIIMTQHDRKDSSGGSMSQMRGGSPFSDLADTVIAIRRIKLRDAEDHVRKDEWGEPLYHPTDLVLKFDKVRHAEGPLPDQMRLTREERFPDGQRNPFFKLRGAFD